MNARRLNRALAIGPLIVFAAVAGIWAAGGRINASNSVARGLWWVSSDAPRVGSYVLVCPPLAPAIDLALQRGYIRGGSCPGGFQPLIKRIAASVGDLVAIDSDGIRVNGELLPHSRPLERDRLGRAFPHLTPMVATLGADDVLLYGDGTPYSIDSRYFGVTDRHAIQSVLRPVLTY